MEETTSHQTLRPHGPSNLDGSPRAWIRQLHSIHRLLAGDRMTGNSAAWATRQPGQKGACGIRPSGVRTAGPTSAGGAGRQSAGSREAVKMTRMPARRVSVVRARPPRTASGVDRTVWWEQDLIQDSGAGHDPGQRTAAGSNFRLAPPAPGGTGPRAHWHNRWAAVSRRQPVAPGEECSVRQKLSAAEAGS